MTTTTKNYASELDLLSIMVEAIEEMRAKGADTAQIIDYLESVVASLKEGGSWFDDEEGRANA